MNKGEIIGYLANCAVQLTSLGVGVVKGFADAQRNTINPFSFENELIGAGAGAGAIYGYNKTREGTLYEIFEVKNGIRGIIPGAIGGTAGVVISELIGYFLGQGIGRLTK
ncbi:MAG: hypothetical protein GXO63_02265 [Candidatus Micrarchaeota archaeon]|nr:hypothetical protein [Candidatus Micrarchaeota archaeon]